MGTRDDAGMDNLRAARDERYYASWKTCVLAPIRRTHRELPLGRHQVALTASASVH